MPTPAPDAAAQDGVGGARRALKLGQLMVCSGLETDTREGQGYCEEVEDIESRCVEAAIPYTGIDTNSCSAP